MKLLASPWFLIAALTAQGVVALPAPAPAPGLQTDEPPEPPPTGAPPAPPRDLPPPPSQPPQGDTQAPQNDSGQWVYTAQYGWVWMPYGNSYVYAPSGVMPSMYVYYPVAGWCWVVAPWLWGCGPSPFFGVIGPWRFGWWGHGFGHWYGFAGRYARWGWAGRGYWAGGRWNGVGRFRGGPGAGFRGAGAPGFHGGGAFHGYGGVRGTPAPRAGGFSAQHSTFHGGAFAGGSSSHGWGGFHGGGSFHHR